MPTRVSTARLLSTTHCLTVATVAFRIGTATEKPERQIITTEQADHRTNRNVIPAEAGNQNQTSFPRRREPRTAKERVQNNFPPWLRTPCGLPFTVAPHSVRIAFHRGSALPVCEFFNSPAVGWNKRSAVPAIRMVIDMSSAGTALCLFQPTKNSQPLRAECPTEGADATESRATETKLIQTNEEPQMHADKRRYFKTSSAFISVHLRQISDSTTR